MQPFPEPIRLVVWDLDETLWRGTLEEGDVVVPPEHAEIVRSLARRGIISSVCSKNDHASAKARLEAAGLWEWIVFPRIEYTFKSNLVADIIEQIGLRPETVLFIDDNPFNRGEVEQRIPGINVAAETEIGELLLNPQLQGKPDNDLNRLARYRVLEQKQTALSCSDDPIEFLRGCEIKLSIHFDIEEQFSRIHELVNRTNQLNFTKTRWKEDVEEALSEYVSATSKEYGSHAGYIKVRDRFGYHGICGFFETLNRVRLRHFLFSCRVLNMGIEQFVYQYLQYPSVKVAEKVVGSLTQSPVVDWIEIVPDAETEVAALSTRSSTAVCLHGPCELVQSAHYLKPHFRIIEEFQYPRAGWAILRPLLRNLMLPGEMKKAGISSVADLGLPADFPGIDFAALGSSMFSPDVDICFWSFSLEPQVSLYRHVPSRLVFPVSIGGFDRQDMTKLAFAKINKRRNLQEDHVSAFNRLFKHVGVFRRDVFDADLERLRSMLVPLGKPFVVIDLFEDLTKIDRVKYRLNREINNRVRRKLDGLANVYHLSFSDCVHDKSEEVHLNHFSRSCYLRLAEKMKAQVVQLLDARRAA